MQPFSYMLFFILVSILFPNNFKYEEGDWFTLSNPESINSITSTNDEIIFCSDNGIFKYNMLTSSFNYQEEYLREFEYSKSLIVHYDDYRDYLWYLNENSLNYKPRISSFWRKIDFYEINLSTYRNIINIGSDYNYIYLDLGNTYKVLNPITGKVIEDQDLVINIDSINWSSSINNDYNNFDLTKYYSFEGYNVISNNLINDNGVNLNVTAIFKDKYHDLWIGTDKGEIFYCDSKMNNIKKIKSIPLITDINMSYYDEYGNWWFSSNDNVIVNEKISIGDELIFFSRWIEDKNEWINYTNRSFRHIFSRDITSFQRLDNWLYIGTTKGLLIYEINTKKSFLIDSEKGLLSNQVNDIIYFNNNIYIATNKGVNILSTFGNILLSIDIFNYFNDSNIFDFNISEDQFIISSELGLFEYIYDSNKIELITEKKYLKAFINNNKDFILSNRNKIFKVTDNNRELLISLDKIKNVCFCNNYLWINSINKSILFNLNDNQSFSYYQSDGIIGNVINHIGCDDYWVWFSTNKGISMYNWSKYHNNEK
tara:strand:- start:26763 stop:28382 length:1620 start_codon:yes stop_codon:yes gene_type:complete